MVCLLLVHIRREVVRDVASWIIEIEVNPISDVGGGIEVVQIRNPPLGLLLLEKPSQLVAELIESVHFIINYYYRE